MKLSLLALVATSLLLASCQKSSPRSVKAKLGVSANSQTSGADQKIDDAMAKGKKLETCQPAFKETKVSLDAVLEKAADFMKNQPEKLDDAGQKQALEMANDIQRKLDLLLQELVNAGAASCEDVSIADLRSATDKAFIGLADKSKKETTASKAARDRLAKKDKSDDEESLVSKTFKISKELAGVLNEDGKAKNVFFMDGSIQTTKENYDKALAQTDKSVCLLQDAPKNNLDESASLNVLDAAYSAVEKQVDAKSGKVAPLTWTMLVRVTSGSEVFSISCRLASNMKRETGAKQFKRAFGELLSQ